MGRSKSFASRGNGGRKIEGAAEDEDYYLKILIYGCICYLVKIALFGGYAMFFEFFQFFVYWPFSECEIKGYDKKT